jgi:hypothetical protein
MSLASLFADLAVHLQSAQFHQSARHPSHPTAFTRHRKLPLATLMALLLSGMRMSVQAELDTFFAHLIQSAQLLRHVSEQAFAQARAKLSLTAIPELNDWLTARAEQDGFVPRWRGLRMVAADASTMHFGLRASHVKHAAVPDQIAFGLFLPGAELMLAASLHSIHERGERQMLFQHLDRLSSSDLLLLDRGYPSCWLVAVLNQRSLPFCMRVDSTGFADVRAFLHSGLDEKIVTLPVHNHRDAIDYECPRMPQTVRLVRHIAANGNVRILMTNLLDQVRFPASCFGDLYHQRWKIEEAFKRLKHRLNLEHVSGLSQQAVVQDVAAKILTDNLHALSIFTAHADAELAASERINRAYANTVLKPLLPALLLGKKVSNLLHAALRLLAKRTYRHRKHVSKPRKPGPKPHKPMTQKPC